MADDRKNAAHPETWINDVIGGIAALKNLLTNARAANNNIQVSLKQRMVEGKYIGFDEAENMGIDALIDVLIGRAAQYRHTVEFFGRYFPRTPGMDPGTYLQSVSNTLERIRNQAHG